MPDPETTTPTAQERAEAWFREFEEALRARDVDARGGDVRGDVLLARPGLLHLEPQDGRGPRRRRRPARARRSRRSTERVRADRAADEADGVVTAWFAFETAVGRGSGLLRLVRGRPDKAWTLLTSLYELKGHEEPRGTHRPMGAEHGADKDRSTWKEQRQARGGRAGQHHPAVRHWSSAAGRAASRWAARLRQLGVPTLVIDKHPRPGDQWRNRYKSLCLHDPVWYDHLPYIKFPDNWPVFAPKDKIGDWLESYVKVMEVPYWSSTTATSAAWSEETQEWTVEVEREGQPLVLRPEAARASRPGCPASRSARASPGMDMFRGDQHHSSAHPGPDAYAGKRAVVIGSNNRAFDICGALWENGADVTMVQRSSTHIVKSDSPDGDRSRCAVLRGGGRGRRHDREGGPDLRVAALPDPARVPDPGVPGDGRARQGLLRPAGEGRLLARLGRRRVGAVHEVPAARLGLLHRRRRGRPGRQRRRRSWCAARSTT